MKRGQTTILLSILVVSIFLSGFASTQSVNAYTELVAGDQLLYKNVFTFYEDLEQRLLHETDVSPTEESWWIIDHWDFEYDEMESYSINSIDTVTANVNYAWSIYDRYNNYTQKDYFYNYGISTWIQNNSIIDLSLFQASNFSVVDYDVFTGILNLDTTDYFGSAVYDRTESNYYVINGVNSSYDVDVYVYAYADNINTPYSYYDCTFQEDNPYGWYDEYFVDSSTGTLLAYSTVYYDNYYASFYKNCATLGTWVDYYYNHTYMYEYTWLLHETTADFNPVADADLPAMLLDFGYVYDIRADSDYLPIYFDLINSWPSMTVDVYLDGVYFESLYGLAPGANIYHLDTTNIPVSTNNHEVDFVVYDDANSEHNTTWSLMIKDIRLDWPSIMGPVGDYYFTLEYSDWLYWYLYDAGTNHDYYEISLNSIVIDSGTWYEGYEISFKIKDYISTEGDYYITIYAVDTLGYYTLLDLTIHASEEPDIYPPEITGPINTIYIDKGDPIQLIWNIKDDNPNSYQVKINGSVYTSSAWTITDFNVVIDLNLLDVGTWFFEIHVYDNDSNHNYASVYVVVEDDAITTPPVATPPVTTPPATNPQPSNSNTLVLDAPGWFYTLLGIVSLLSIVTFYKKRK